MPFSTKLLLTSFNVSDTVLVVKQKFRLNLIIINVNIYKVYKVGTSTIVKSIFPQSRLGYVY